MAYEQIDSITRRLFLPNLVDNILDDCPLLKLMVKNGEGHNGGNQILQPVKYAKNQAGGSYIRGQRFDVNAYNTRTKFTFEWKYNYQSLVLWGMDIAMNQGDARVMDHVSESMEEAEADFKDKLATQLFSDGTGNGGADWTGLNAVVDSGANVATYGAISRTTNTWAAAGLTASVGTLSIPTLQTGYRSAKSGGKRPKLMVTTETIFDIVENFYLPTLQNGVVSKVVMPNGTEANDGLSGQYGFTSLFYKGMPVIADEYCPSGTLYMLNTDFLALHWLKNPRLGGTKMMGVGMTKMKEPVDQDGEVAQLISYAQVVCSQPRTNYRFTGITG